MGKYAEHTDEDSLNLIHKITSMKLQFTKKKLKSTKEFYSQNSEENSKIDDQEKVEV